MKTENNLKKKSDISSERIAVPMVKFQLQGFPLRSPRPETSQIRLKKKKIADVITRDNRIVTMAKSSPSGAMMISTSPIMETLSGLGDFIKRNKSQGSNC